MNIFKRIVRIPGRFIRYGEQFLKVKNILGIGNLLSLLYFLQFVFSVGFHHYESRMKGIAAKISKNEMLGGWFDFYCSALIYIIVRHKKPKIMIETGVGPGSTSAVILKALADNKCGILHSIDLPGHDAIAYPKIGKAFNIHVPEGFEVGWLIMPKLKKRWKLIIGDSKEKLPELLREIGHVDIFLHDSLHTDEHIIMEFSNVFSYMKKHSILLCDDVEKNWSLAFIDFCKQKRIPYFIFGNRLGIAKNR